MALEDKDRELIDLIVAQKVREQLDQNRGALLLEKEFLNFATASGVRATGFLRLRF